MEQPVYSVIIPIHNEAESLPILLRELGKRYEIIVVDDRSTDSSGRYATLLLPQRAGKWAALRAGIAKAKGRVIITMDGDLQDDPREIPKLLKKLDEGYDIVSGWRKVRRDPLYKIFLTRIANTIYGFRDFSSPYKIYRREVLSLLPTEGSLLRYSLLFGRKLHLKIAEIPVAHRPRRFGNSKFGLLKYFRIFWDLVLITLLFSGSGQIEDHTDMPMHRPADNNPAVFRRGQDVRP
jgi:glycosyltransferase involved in cell wall biosynthesis